MDEDYNPDIEVYINEPDDEQTIEEEENLSEDSDNSKEIEKLKEESEIPIETLLMMYKKETIVNNNNNNNNKFKEKKDKKNGSISNKLSFKNNKYNEIENEENEENGEDFSEDELDDDSRDDEDDFDDDNDDDDDDNDEDDENLKNNDNKNHIDCKYKKNKELLNFINNNNSLSEEDDFDYEPNINKTAKIKIGSEYQIEIDQTCQIYDPEKFICNNNYYDDLLWSPYKLDENSVIDYLKLLQKNENFINLKEDEKALCILNECNYKIEDAILMYNQLKLKNENIMIWTEKENEAFEEGYKEFGKDFRQIQEKKCKNFTIGELVNYYYLWKKTERHDTFINKHKIKKKNHLHSKATDYMEKFIIDKDHSLEQTQTIISIDKESMKEKLLDNLSNDDSKNFNIKIEKNLTKDIDQNNLIDA